MEAEQQAQALAAEAREKKLRLRENLSESAENLLRDYLAQADTRIDAVREREETQTNDAIEGINLLHRLEMENMQRLFEEHRDEWVEKLYTMVVGRS
jgi:F0F1-type ATP synthase membrane subunit b/b'